MGKGIYYCEPVFRPPSEANSLLLHATVGCTHRCSFCVPYVQKKFSVRSFDEIAEDIDIAETIYGHHVRKVFLLDGNALAAPAELLLKTTNYLNEKFTTLQRVSVYAHVDDILKKSEAELAALSQAGLKLAYIGIESGNDELLKRVSKHQTAEKIVEAFHKCFRTGITPSGTIILGLAGDDKELSVKHAKESAELVNRLSPVHAVKGGKLPAWYISCLALMIPPGTKIYNDTAEGKFEPTSSEGILNEMKIFMENISDDVQKCIFRSNHASNYLPLAGTLNKDKQKLLDQINNTIEKKNITPEAFRGL